MLGSIVVKGCAPVLAWSKLVAALKKVDLPADGLPWSIHCSSIAERQYCLLVIKYTSLHLLYNRCITQIKLWLKTILTKYYW